MKGLLQSTEKGGSSIDDYMLKMKQYAESLAEAGEPIGDDSLSLYILSGLGPEYESVVVNLTNRTKPLTLQDLQFSLQSHEMGIQQNAASTLESVQANLANLSVRGNRGN